MALHLSSKSRHPKTIALEAQFGLVLNWAFIAQSSCGAPVIKVINVLIQ